MVAAEHCRTQDKGFGGVRNSLTGWEGDALVLPYRWSFRDGGGCAQKEICNLAKINTIKITNVILHNFAADKK
jgi:hypothetical protein